MNSVAQKLFNFTLLGVVLTACDPSRQTPLELIPSSVPETTEMIGAAQSVDMTDEQWIEAVLKRLDQDPQKDFDLEALKLPSNRDFSEWAAESLLAASFTANQGDISVSIQELVEGNPNLSLWFSEQFTKDVLEVNTKAANSPAAVEAGQNVLVPVVQSSTKLRTAECRTEPANLCALVLTVDWHVNNVQALLVFVSSLDDGQWTLRRFDVDNRTYAPVQSVKEYLAKVQADQELQRKLLADQCRVNPLQDEIACLGALNLDELGLQQLVTHLCATQTAEGATLEQCGARFNLSCSNPEDEALIQNCQSMARAGFTTDSTDEDAELSDDDQDTVEGSADEADDSDAASEDEGD